MGLKDLLKSRKLSLGPKLERTPLSTKLTEIKSPNLPASLSRNFAVYKRSSLPEINNPLMEVKPLDLIANPRNETIQLKNHKKIL